MSTPHHFSGDEEVIQRFIDQGERKAAPSFPLGKMNEQDEGELAFAIAIDERNMVIKIDFNKPATWFAMELEPALKFQKGLAVFIARLQLLHAKHVEKSKGI